MYRYAFAVALITWGMHANDRDLTSTDKVLRGLAYFGGLCVFWLVIQLVAASIQAARTPPRTITFREDDLLVEYQGKTTRQLWDWIMAAEESATTITLMIEKFPRLGLFLPKKKLTPAEYEILRGWLVEHGKLAATAGRA